MKICLKCKEEFTPKNPLQKFCTTKCRLDYKPEPEEKKEPVIEGAFIEKPYPRPLDIF